MTALILVIDFNYLLEGGVILTENSEYQVTVSHLEEIAINNVVFFNFFDKKSKNLNI